MINKSSGDVGRILKDVFGFNSFRPNQREIVDAILAREDAFVVMPTGGGKSLCYQLPAYVMDGTCIVISPLISLMKDQVDAAVATGLRAALLNSSLTVVRKRQVQAELEAGELDLIYVSPERFAMPEFIEALKGINLSLVAIDEAHCISEWGHDFRPDYLNLSTITKTFPEVPVAAFTATATHRVQDDIVKKLGLRSPHYVRASFNRPNLQYKVIAKQKPSDQIMAFVREHEGESGIIYRTTRKSVEQTAGMLAKKGIKALPYHAGMSDVERAANQEAFNKDEVDVIVATIAFGMGIDKSNVRYVLHGDLPKNVESYYQETGRAGRDGEPALCLLLFGYGDIPKIRFFLDQVEDDAERQNAMRCLNSMVSYATVHACRRKQLLNYFGEEYPAHSALRISHQPSTIGPAGLLPCCDVCADEVDSIDATTDAQIVLSAIIRTGERFGATHIVDVVCGADTERIRQLGHDQIKTYGAGKDQAKSHWRFIIDNLLAQGYVTRTDDQYPVLKVTESARTVLSGKQTVRIMKPRIVKKKKTTGVSAGGPYNEQLFEELRELRKKIATKQGVPPFVVFSDRTLHEMARDYPVTDIAMLDISGVGASKLERYGKTFSEAISKYLENHQPA